VPSDLRRARSCAYPIAIEGSIHGDYIRKSQGIRNWEAAQKYVRERESGNASFEVVSVTRACDASLSEREGRHLALASISKYKLLTRELKDGFGDPPVSSIMAEDLMKYRQKWELGPTSSSKKLERLKTFVRFAGEAGWARHNPAKSLKPLREN
jgi:hypothetical protein